MKYAFRFLSILLCAVIAGSLLRTEEMLEQIEHSVIRLHILADSDSTADQTVKLLVRDELLKQADTWIPAGSDWAEGCAAIQSHLPQIRKVAADTLKKAGCDAPVSVSFGESDFPARQYGEITLPAGTYQALRVEIGSGSGQNWWCVMYPALCLPASSAQSLTECSGEGIPAIAEQPETYQIRLKCVDTIRSVIRWLRGK